MTDLRVLLVNPPDPAMEGQPLYSEDLREATKSSGRYPHIGLAYVAASIEKAGFDVAILDANALGLNLKECFEQCLRFKPDIVGLTATTPSFPLVRRLARLLKEADLKVMIGGKHATVMPDAILKTECFDYVVRGEGEVTVVDLLYHLDNVEGVKGVSYIDHGVIRHNPSREYVKNLDILPFPARHLLPNHLYFSPLALRNPVTVMITSRGCPYNCIFCDPLTRGGPYRLRSPENVVKELEEVVYKHNIREVMFYDDTFTVSRKWVEKLCKYLIQNSLDIVWDCRTRVDKVDYELLRLMRKAGCYRVHFGVESSSEETLAFLRKGIKPVQAEAAIKAARKAGLITVAYFMLGTPGENLAMIVDTINYAIRLNPDFVEFSITTAYPNTDLFSFCVEKGFMNADYWLNYTLFDEVPPPPSLVTSLRREELEELTRAAYRMFYFRPRYILHRLSKLRSLTQLKYNVKALLTLLLR